MMGFDLSGAQATIGVMDAHVTSTDFIAGTTVGLYPPQTRPEEHQDPIETVEVPDTGQLVIERAVPRERFWLAGYDTDGRWKTVQVHSKPGDPVDVRQLLADARPEESEPDLVVGQRTTAHRPQRKRR